MTTRASLTSVAILLVLFSSACAPRATPAGPSAARAPRPTISLAMPVRPPAARRPGENPPPVLREFRGAWVASVANIDWPSRRDLSPWEQQAELIAILNRVTALGLNAVILQIRPAGDALYESTLEPWSPYLTGTMGVAPEPFYDPLAFAVAEAHRRGLELHAWFNPYRARHPSDTSALAATHIAVRRPDLVKRYGSFLWMDPGEPDVLTHTKNVIVDVVNRYDVDGVHIDDYFYPYPERDSSGALIPFPDDSSYGRYTRAGGRLDRGDWRRENVDRLVAEVYYAIRAAKPHVKFGVSPFGIWRPGTPPGVQGFDAYSAIFADARKWLRNGWLDYVAPQLYWRSSAPQQPFAPLLAWWGDENARRRHLWPGLNTNRTDTVEATNRWRAGEILEQIRLTRAEPRAGGHIHFSIRTLRENRDSISNHLALTYVDPALIPASPWLDAESPPAPFITPVTDSATGGVVAHLRAGSTDPVWIWVVHERYADGWTTVLLPGSQRTRTVTRSRREPRPLEIALLAVDRAGNVSATTRAPVPRP